jgi:DNA-binding NtrC family response regulator
VQARVIAATNRPLQDLVRDGLFRPDLFYRLDVLRIEIPPLRERLEDIPVLAQHFVNRFQCDSPNGVKGFTAAALRALTQYDWPGNVRQLRNLVHRACVVAPKELIDEPDLPRLESEPSPADEANPAFPRLTLAEIERRAILERIRECQGNKSMAAAALGVTARTLRNKVNEYRRLGFAA